MIKINLTKNLTLICQQPEEAGKANTPWTRGEWVTIYHEIVSTIMEVPDGTKYNNPSLIINQYLNKKSEGIIVTSSKKGLLWLEALIENKVPSVRTTCYSSLPLKWSALNLKVGFWPIDKNSEVPILKKISENNCITPHFSDEIQLDKVNTEVEPSTGDTQTDN